MPRNITSFEQSAGRMRKRQSAMSLLEKKRIEFRRAPPLGSRVSTMWHLGQETVRHLSERVGRPGAHGTKTATK